MVESPREPAREPLPGAPDRMARVLLGAALVVGLVRFVRLGRWSLWFDEAVTLADAHHGIDAGQVYNPLGYLAIKYTVALLGGVPDEFALRLLPAVLGWATIPLTWWAFRPFTGSRRASLAALLVAVSSWHVYWSQNARFYTMAMAAGLLGSGFVLRGFFRGGALRALLGAAIVAAGTWLHLQSALLFGALVLAPAVLFALRIELTASARRASLVLLGLCGAGLLVRLPWVREVWQTYQGSKATDASLASQLASVAHFLLTMGFFVTPLLGVAFLLGALLGLRERDSFDAFAVAVILILCLATALASLFARVSAQYAFVLLPWIAVVGARPVDLLRQRAGAAAAWGFAALLVLPALASTALYFSVRHGDRPRWREAYSFVWAQRQPNDLVLGMSAPVGEYYLAPGRTDLRDPRVVGWLDEFHANVPDEWTALGRRTWLLVRPEYLKTWRPDDLARFRALLREECRLMQSFPVAVEGRDLSVEVWLREGL